MTATQLLIGDECPCLDRGDERDDRPGQRGDDRDLRRSECGRRRRAVAAARIGFESEAWQSLTPDATRRILWRIAELIETNAAELAALETADQGQPTFVSTTINIPLAAQTFRYYAGWATKLEGKVSPVSIRVSSPTSSDVRSASPV